MAGFGGALLYDYSFFFKLEEQKHKFEPLLNNGDVVVPLAPLIRHLWCHHLLPELVKQLVI